MTIVNATHGFIFIHVPKTAGTFVKHYLARYGAPADISILNDEDSKLTASRHKVTLHKHSTAAQVRKAVGRQAFSEAFKFTVVRNPFERAISIYRFLKHNFRKWPRAEIMDRFQTFEEFVMSDFFDEAGPGGIIRPQARWIANRNGELLVDLACRTEQLDRDLELVRERLGLRAHKRGVARQNESRGDYFHPRLALSSRAVIDRIRKRYREDFRLLGYSEDVGDSTIGPIADRRQSSVA